MGIVEVEQDGQNYSAEYVLEDHIMTVFGDGGQESTQLDGMSEEATARILLRRLIRKVHIESVVSE